MEHFLRRRRAVTVADSAGNAAIASDQAALSTTTPSDTDNTATTGAALAKTQGSAAINIAFDPISGATADLAAWRTARNILVVRPDNLGDVLMTSPALRAIKQTQPKARITLLASASGAAAALHLPMIDDVLAVDVPWVRHERRRTEAAAERALIADLAQRHFDAAIIFTVYTQSALPAAFTCYLADIPLRLGFCRENPYQLLTHWVREQEPQALQRHEVERQLALAQSVGYQTDDTRLSFDYLPIERASAQRKRLRAGLDPQRPYIVIHPGATAASRRWPTERFGQAAHLLQQTDPSLQVLMVGGNLEAPLLEQVQHEAPGAIALAGQLSLGELAATIDEAALLLCNNSGPAHIAAARNTPVVVLYALTNPQHTPWQVPSKVLFADVACRNCYRSSCPQTHHRCLLDVYPEQVAQAARQLLQESTIRFSTPPAAEVAALLTA